MEDLEKILEGLDRINKKLEQILAIQRAEKIDEIYWALPKRTHKEILNV